MIRVTFLGLIGYFLSVGFTLQAIKGDPSKITKRNVELRIPPGFPKPVYTFENNRITPEGFMLGRTLFHDPILSKDSTVSCATCHQQFAAFAHIDHKLSHGVENRIGNRNVPALQNLIWKDNFMWDGGINHLEVQPINPIVNPNELGESLENVLKKLARSSKYKSLFMSSFGDTVVNSERMLKSLAQFMGLMISSNSNYDRYLRGEIDFNESELRGLRLFEEKCSSCHKTPLFTDNSFAENGIGLDASLNDRGRGAISLKSKDDYLFKVPSLRNCEVTFPYMHDGRFKSLREVLDHYSKISSDPANKRLAKIGQLSNQDKDDLELFLLTLTDKSFLYDRRFMSYK